MRWGTGRGEAHGAYEDLLRDMNALPEFLRQLSETVHSTREKGIRTFVVHFSRSECTL